MVSKKRNRKPLARKPLARNKPALPKPTYAELAKMCEELIKESDERWHEVKRLRHALGLIYQKAMHCDYSDEMAAEISSLAFRTLSSKSHTFACKPSF